MYVHTCACVYVYVYVCICVCIYIYVYTYVITNDYIIHIACNTHKHTTITTTTTNNNNNNITSSKRASGNYCPRQTRPRESMVGVDVVLAHYPQNTLHTTGFIWSMFEFNELC